MGLEARKKNLCLCSIRWGAGGADDGEPRSHGAFVIRQWRGGVDRPSDRKDRITTKIESIKERTDIQDGWNLSKGEPQVSSILHMNTEPVRGATGPNVPISRRFVAITADPQNLSWGTQTETDCEKEHFIGLKRQ